MIGFLLKKNFYDLWDNLFRIALLNLGFILSLAVLIFVPRFVPVPALAVAIFAVVLLWCSVYLSAVALSVKAISDYGRFSFADFLANFKQGWPAGIAVGIGGIVLLVVARFTMQFYLGMDSMTGLLLATFAFWTLALFLIPLQFFFAIRARLDTKLVKICKKGFIIFFDNPGFSIFTLLHTMVLLALSLGFPFLLLIPGPAGMLLFLDEALRLRLLKYDWLEANPPAATTRRPHIPWDVILIEEREKTGTRTLRNFIFPWKD